jgi:hypothetical protein
VLYVAQTVIDADLHMYDFKYRTFFYFCKKKFIAGIVTAKKPRVQQLAEGYWK